MTDDATPKLFQKKAYRLLEPSIDSLVISARNSGLSNLELKKIIGDDISLYGGIYLYLREFLPVTLNTKPFCAKIASHFLSDKTNSNSNFDFDFKSDMDFLLSSISPLDKKSWSDPKQCLKNHFGILNNSINRYLTSDFPDKNISSTIESISNIKSDSKIKGLTDYIFNPVNRSDVIGNNSLIESLENVASAFMHYDFKLKKNVFDFNPYILLEGDPGTGKTLTSKYIMSYIKDISKENNLNTRVVTMDFEDRWQNGPIENIKNQFQELSRGDTLYVVFFDEIDLKFPTRTKSNSHSQEQILGELLRFRGGVYSNYPNYIFLATTNDSSRLDYALNDVFVKHELKPSSLLEDKINILKLNLGFYADNYNWDNVSPLLDSKEFTGRKLMQLSKMLKDNFLSCAKSMPYKYSFEDKQNLIKNNLSNSYFSEKELIKIIERGEI